MLRVLVLANDSLLSDAIKSVLVREGDFDVLRLSYHEIGDFDQVIRDQYSVLIVVNEKGTDLPLFEPARLFMDLDWFLMITISQKKQFLQIFLIYQIPNPGMAEVIDLVREFSGLKAAAESGMQQG